MTPDVVERAQLYKTSICCCGKCESIRDLLALVQQLTTARDAYRGALVRLVREANEGGMLLPLEAVEALRDADAAAGRKDSK